MFCEVCSSTSSESPLVSNRGSHICVKCLVGFNDVVIQSTEFLPFSAQSFENFSNKILNKLQEELTKSGKN